MTVESLEDDIVALEGNGQDEEDRPLDGTTTTPSRSSPLKASPARSNTLETTAYSGNSTAEMIPRRASKHSQLSFDVASSNGRMSLDGGGSDVASMPESFSGSFLVGATNTAGGSSRRKSVVAHTIEPQKRQSNSLDDFTINRLNLDNLRLFGRDKEIAILRDKLKQSQQCATTQIKLEQNSTEKDSVTPESRAMNTTNTAATAPIHNTTKKVIFLSGYSGVGKSALAKHALQEQSKDGLYVDGKFEFSSSQPYMGIQSACGQVCGHILWEQQFGKPELAEAVCRDIVSQLSTELDLLFQFLPVLHEILDDYQSTIPTLASATTGNAEDAKNRFHYIFCTFLRIVASHFYPLIIVLDDLQWADAASLHLMEVLIADRQPFSTNIMLVGIYRSNEVMNNLVFRQLLKETQEKGKKGALDLVDLELGNLSLPAVHALVNEVLRIDDDTNTRSKSLAQMCMNKTHGNVFFLLHFLMMLSENDLVKFNFGTMQWEWNEEDIEQRTQATDNVVDLLQTEMKRQLKNDADLTQLMKLAACLGSSFQVHSLRLLWETRESTEDDENGDTLLSLMDQLVNEGYLAHAAKRDLYCWAHDNIQQAALSLISEDTLPWFCRDIGNELESKLDEKALDESLFVVVNLLNNGPETTDQEQCVKLCSLNLRASQKALGVSSFGTAALYASNGIKHIGNVGEAWMKCPELMLGLHMTGAKAEGSIGNTQTMEDYCKNVISQPKLGTEDKLDAYLIWIDGILNQGDAAKAVQICLDVLAQFNCRIASNPVSMLLAILSNVLSIKATMKSFKTSDIQQLNDLTRIKLVQVLDQCSTCMYLAADDRLPLCVFRNLNWTVEYGYCDYSPVAFATTGGILTGVLNDLPGGALYSEHAVALLEKTQSRGIHARTSMVLYGITFTWTKPLRSLLKPLLLGYDNGLKAGDVESASWCIYLYCTHQYWLGTSLSTVIDNLLVYSSQMRNLKKFIQADACDIMRQALQKLTGQDASSLPSSGEVVSMQTQHGAGATSLPSNTLHGDVTSKEDITKFENDKALADAVYQWRGILCTYFSHHIEAADDVILHGHDFISKLRPASLFVMWDACLKAVSCFAAATLTGKTKYKNMARLLRSKVKKWVQMGNINIRHMHELIEAEWHTFKGNKSAATSAYKSAILLSARDGYQYGAALCSERFGEFHLLITQDADEANYRFGQAAKYWQEWGALAKAEALIKKYPNAEEIIAKKNTERVKLSCAMRLVPTSLR